MAVWLWSDDPSWQDLAPSTVRLQLQRLRQMVRVREEHLNAVGFAEAFRQTQALTWVGWWTPWWNHQIQLEAQRMGNMKDAKDHFDKHKQETFKAVTNEKDPKAAVKMLLLAQAAFLRAAFETEHADHMQGYEAAMAGVSAAEATVDEAVAAVFANTGH